ncbi:Gfo/Idh/MocA family protein [Rhodococcus jostii]|uniref:Predicted dehydrogenase n=1 Tax=Rhodococcus jostii TaxID=132919 RepID=A0A1H5M7A6_RHOJO|nr:Gfo/Idh/MocA family oxidoreductase [Rhodococcus jostii]SEE84611.1 Predicted dehydrogenase [Rhodococcus jostii]
MSTPRTVGVGLISVGWMGQLHTRAYRDVPIVYPELGITPKLVIAADTAESRVEFAENVLGFAEGTTDYREVLAHPDVDVVSICAPNFLHAEIGIAAAKAGKHFWIEKPVGRSHTETAAIETAATDAGVITSIGYNYRHAPAVEHARKLIADGTLGRITNVRASFFSGYANEPNGALSWRFDRELAGSGVLADLFSHASDLCQYVVGPIAEINALTSTVYTERPKLEMGSGTHFAVIENGDMGPVENEDYAAALVRFGAQGPGSGAVGTIEASRVIVGPECGYQIEVYGTEGSLKWDFERMNELKLCLGRTNAEQGYTTVNASPKHGDYSRFQPGPGNALGFDDLKTIEAKKFLLAVSGGPQENSNVHDAVSAAAIVTAAEVSASTGQWQKLDDVAGTTASRTA